MSDDRKVAISIKNVSKDFKLPHHNQPSSIKSVFVNPFRSRDNKTTANYNEKQHALKDISFDIYEGEFFGIVGKNGSGKSTLLKIIAGIYKPNKGSVQYAGKLVPFIELGVGFNPELTGRDNVYLSGALMGYSTGQIDEKYDSIVEFAELGRFMDQLLKNYSSGMQVRLAFSVATILGDSDILLIDEVLAVGDADFQRKCFNYFKHLKKLKKTIVFVSHDMEAVREYCDRAALIDDSEVQIVGDVHKVASSYTKMFTPSAVEADAGKQKRWGDKNAKIDKPKVEVGRNHDVSISYEVEGESEVICGFSVRNAAGENILGTNSKILRKKFIATKPSKAVQFAFKDVLNDGEYSVDLALISTDKITVHDWWEGALLFNIKKDSHTNYKVAPPITFKEDAR